ncbi:hypothetical protein ABK040_016259 [Willaertia magna]
MITNEIDNLKPISQLLDNNNNNNNNNNNTEIILLIPHDQSIGLYFSNNITIDFIQTHVAFLNQQHQFITMNGIRGILSDNFDFLNILEGPPTGEECLAFFKDPNLLFTFRKEDGTCIFDEPLKNIKNKIQILRFGDISMKDNLSCSLYLISQPITYPECSWLLNHQNSDNLKSSNSLKTTTMNDDENMMMITTTTPLTRSQSMIFQTNHKHNKNKKKENLTSDSNKSMKVMTDNNNNKNNRKSLILSSQNNNNNKTFSPLSNMNDNKSLQQQHFTEIDEEEDSPLFTVNNNKTKKHLSHSYPTLNDKNNNNNNNNNNRKNNNRFSLISTIERSDPEYFNPEATVSTSPLNLLKLQQEQEQQEEKMSEKIKELINKHNITENNLFQSSNEESRLEVEDEFNSFSENNNLNNNNNVLILDENFKPINNNVNNNFNNFNNNNTVSNQQQLDNFIDDNNLFNNNSSSLLESEQSSLDSDYSQYLNSVGTPTTIMNHSPLILSTTNNFNDTVLNHPLQHNLTLNNIDNNNQINNQLNNNNNQINNNNLNNNLNENNNTPLQSTTQKFDFKNFTNKLKDKSVSDIARKIKRFVFEIKKTEYTNDLNIIVHTFIEGITIEIKEHPLWKNANDNDITNVREGLEKYITNKIYEKVFSPTIDDIEKDNEIASRLSLFKRVIEPENLDLSKKTIEDFSFQRAVDELKKMNTYKTPRDKMICISNCCHIVMSIVKKHVNSNASADDFIPLLIFTVLKANPPHLHSNIKFIYEYRNPEFLNGPTSYFLTSLESAMTFWIACDHQMLNMDEKKFKNLLNKEYFEDDDFVKIEIPLKKNNSAVTPNNKGSSVNNNNGGGGVKNNKGGLFGFSSLSTNDVLREEAKQITKASTMTMVNSGDNNPLKSNVDNNKKMNKQNDELFLKTSTRGDDFVDVIKVNNEEKKLALILENHNNQQQEEEKKEDLNVEDDDQLSTNSSDDIKPNEEITIVDEEDSQDVIIKEEKIENLNQQNMRQNQQQESQQQEKKRLREEEVLEFIKQQDIKLTFEHVPSSQDLKISEIDILLKEYKKLASLYHFIVKDNEQK